MDNDNGAVQYRRFLSGDDEGFVEIIRMYNDGLVLFINGYVKNIYVAEDLAEDTFFKLLIKKPKFAEISNFKTWLYTIGRNLARDYLKKTAKMVDMPDEGINAMQQEEISVEKRYLIHEERIMLHQAISRLLPQYSEVLYLAYFELLSNIEIAHVIHKSQKQVANLLFRAKAALKGLLIEEGYEYEGF